MSVTELIEKLQALPENEKSKQVFTFHCGDCSGDQIGDARIVEWGVQLI